MTSPLKLPMRGATDLRGIMSSFLQDNLPATLDVYRAAYPDLTVHTLPDPKEYGIYDPISAKDYPAVGIIVNNDHDHVRTETDTIADQNEYWTVYQVRLFVLALTPKVPDPQTGKAAWTIPEYDTAIRCCEDLTAAIQALLLSTPTLGDSRVRMEETTLQTDYVAPQQTSTQNKIWIGNSMLSMEIQLQQFSLPFALGTPGLPLNINTEIGPL